LEVRLSIHAIDSFVIDVQAFAIDERVQPPIPEARTFAGVRHVDVLRPTSRHARRRLVPCARKRLPPRDGAYH
jgi:hypothetical protein